MFDTVEQERLDAASRGYLLQLEQIGILRPAQREIVIDRLLALDNEEIDVEQTKWVVMMVLFSQPGQQEAFAQMEDLVYADDSAWVHLASKRTRSQSHDAAFNAAALIGYPAGPQKLALAPLQYFMRPVRTPCLRT